MKYTVVAENLNGDVQSTNGPYVEIDDSKFREIAREFIDDADDEYPVFVTVQFVDGDNKGFYNPDGNHSPVGQFWK